MRERRTALPGQHTSPAVNGYTYLDEPSPEYYEKAKALLKAEQEREDKVTE